MIHQSKAKRLVLFATIELNRLIRGLETEIRAV